MNLLPSVVHVSSTIESGAPRIDCLALFANSPFSTLKSYQEPHKLLVIRVSSTIESRAPQIDCLALFVCSPPSSLKPHGLIA